jgi:hypothetical protein
VKDLHVVGEKMARNVCKMAIHESSGFFYKIAKNGKQKKMFCESY